MSRSHETQPNQEPHELATLTLEKTTLYVGEGIGHRIGSFSDDVSRRLLEVYRLVDLPIKVMMRDRHKCIITVYQDVSHPLPDENVPSVFLKACHILRRAVGKFDKDHKSNSVRLLLSS